MTQCDYEVILCTVCVRTLVQRSTYGDKLQCGLRVAAALRAPACRLLRANTLRTVPTQVRYGPLEEAAGRSEDDDSAGTVGSRITLCSTFIFEGAFMAHGQTWGIVRPWRPAHAPPAGRPEL